MLIETLNIIFIWVGWLLRQYTLLVIVFLVFSIISHINKTGVFPLISVLMAFILGWRVALKFNLKDKSENNSKIDPVITINNNNNNIETILVKKEH